MRMIDLRNATEKLTWTDVSFTRCSLCQKLNWVWLLTFLHLLFSLSQMFNVGWTWICPKIFQRFFHPFYSFLLSHLIIVSIFSFFFLSIHESTSLRPCHQERSPSDHSCNILFIFHFVSLLFRSFSLSPFLITGCDLGHTKARMRKKSHSLMDTTKLGYLNIGHMFSLSLSSSWQLMDAFEYIFWTWASNISRKRRRLKHM